MNFSAFSLLLGLCCCCQLAQAQLEPPTITTCGEQYICISDTSYNLCVRISTDSSFMGTIDSFIVDWGDGNEETLPGNPGEYEHRYDLAHFFGECVFDQSYNIGLFTYVAGEPEPLFNGSLVVFRNPPRARFSFVSDTICAGDEAEMVNNSCPEGFAVVGWDYGDQTMGEENHHVYPDVGRYYVKMVIKNACGLDSTIRALEVIPPPKAVARPLSGTQNSVSPYLVCLIGGGNVQLDASLSEYAAAYRWGPISGDYNWSNPHSIQAGLSFKEPGFYDIVLTVESVCGRLAYDTLHFEVIDDIILQLNRPPDTCEVIEYTPVPLIADASYTINGNLYSASDFPIPLGIGNHVIEARLNNQCGLQGRMVNFDIRAAEAVEIISPLDTSLCKGSAPISLTTNLEGGTWQGDFITMIGEESVFDPVAPGLYTLIYSLGHGRCQRSDTLNIEVQGLELNATDFAICPWSDPLPLSALPNGGVWSSNECPACVAQDTFFPNQLQGRTSVDLIYTLENDLGCQDSISVIVEVHEPQAHFDITSPPCTEQSLELDISEAIGAHFTWRINGAEVDPPPFEHLAAGEQELEMVAIIGGCRDSITHAIDLISAPHGVAFNLSDTSICPDLGILLEPIANPLNEDSTGMLTYTWSFNRWPDDTLQTFWPPDSIYFANTTDAPLNYTIALSSENECGQVTEDTTITVLPLPQAAIGVDSTQSGCSPFSVLLTNRSTGGRDSCAWDFGDGQRWLSCADTISHTFIAPDSITPFMISLLSVNSCGASLAMDTITVIPPGVDAFYNISDDDFIVCPNDTIQFEDASTPIPTLWQWDFGDNSSSTLANPTHVYHQSVDTFTVTLRVSTGCGSDFLTRQIITLAAPAVDFELPEFTCQDSPTTGIINWSEPNYHSFLWDFGNGQKDSTHFDPLAPIFSVAEDSAEIKLTLFSFPDLCENTIAKQLWVREKPLAEMTLTDSSNCVGFEFSGQAKALGNYPYQWEWALDGVVLSQNDRVETLIAEEGKQVLSLTASYEGLCASTVSRVIEGLDCRVYIPNAFSPNGDAHNDYFNIYATENSVTEVLNLAIFDRTGALVFSRSNFLPVNYRNEDIEGWDGNTKGKAQNPGVFVYLVEVLFSDGKVKVMTGDLTLIR